MTARPIPRRVEGMTPWAVQAPPRGVLLRFCEEYSGIVWTGYWDGIDIPMSNVSAPTCLWWKRTGIALWLERGEEVQCQSGTNAGIAALG